MFGFLDGVMIGRDVPIMTFGALIDNRAVGTAGRPATKLLYFNFMSS